MSAAFDIVGVGCAAVDELLFVESYPEPDAKVRVMRRERDFGGLTGTALVAASRMGARCAYAGRLGTDPSSLAVEENFRRNGVDVTLAPRDAAYGVVHSTIVVGLRGGTRNVFSMSGGSTGAHEDLPERSVIRGSRVLFVDHHGVTGAVRAAAAARGAGVAVVADFERNDHPDFAELLTLVDHLVLSEGFARRLTGCGSAPEAVRRLWRDDRAAVVVTCGAEGCWFRSEERAEPERIPALRTDVVDTTGCGDVFHGAYAAALAFGMPLRERLRFAAAAAGLKAARPGGQAAIPTRAQVDQAMDEPGAARPLL